MQEQTEGHEMQSAGAVVANAKRSHMRQLRRHESRAAVQETRAAVDRTGGISRTEPSGSPRPFDAAINNTSPLRPKFRSVVVQRMGANSYA